MREWHGAIAALPSGMAVIACDACGGKMNDGLAVCPHCGARRALTARPVLSGDEIRALLATDQSTRDPEPRGLVQSLVLPHPATRRAARLAEIALTVVGLPIVISGAITIALTRRARLAASGGEVAAALTMTVFCGPGLFLVPTVLVVASIAAIWLRALIRIRSAARRGVDLHRIDPPARERPAPLPERSESPAPPRVAAPRAPEPPASSGEPRLLR